MKIINSKNIVSSLPQKLTGRSQSPDNTEVSYVMRRSVLAALMGYHKRRVDKNTKLTISDRLFG